MGKERCGGAEVLRVSGREEQTEGIRKMSTQTAATAS